VVAVLATESDYDGRRGEGPRCFPAQRQVDLHAASGLLVAARHLAVRPLLRHHGFDLLPRGVKGPERGPSAPAHRGLSPSRVVVSAPCGVTTNRVANTLLVRGPGLGALADAGHLLRHLPAMPGGMGGSSITADPKAHATPAQTFRTSEP